MNETPDSLEALRDAVLRAALPNVVFDGWSLTTLQDGARSAGLTDFDVARAFPAGEAEAVAHFAHWADRQMLARLAGGDTDLAGLKVRQRIHAAIRARLEVLAPYKEAVRRAIAFSALPVHCALGPKTLYDTVDAIWYAAGDTATDFNFYTKRALLAAVLTAVTLYWLEDSSDDHVETWGFLDRRINDALGLGRAMGGVGGAVEKAAMLLNNLPTPARFLRRLKEAGCAPAEMGGPMGGPTGGRSHPSA